MEDNVCRIIKISKEALLEFIYENFINQEEKLFDLETKVGISNHFDINWETGEFLFLAHNGEDDTSKKKKCKVGLEYTPNFYFRIYFCKI